MYTLVILSDRETLIELDLPESLTALGVDFDAVRYIGVQHMGEDLCGVHIPTTEEIEKMIKLVNKAKLD